MEGVSAMKTNLELTVYYQDGRAAVEQTARNDEPGREQIDRIALNRLGDPDVLRVVVAGTDRIAQTGRKSYR